MARKFWKLLHERALFGVRQLAAAFDAGSLLPARPFGAGVAAIILVTLLVSCRRQSAPELQVFRRLPADRLATWQVDVASLRRSLLPLPPELSGVDRISGVITTDRRTYAFAEPGMTGRSLKERELILKLAPGPTASGPLPDASAIPPGAQFWMLADPRAFSTNNQALTLTFGKTTVELPGDLVTRAQRLTASGHAGAMGMDLTIDTEYSDAADPQRLAPSVGGVLHLARGSSLNIDTQVSAQGNHILIQAKVGPAEAGKLLLGWMTKN